MSKLPAFKAVTLAELRGIWTKYPDPEIRRLTLEVEHYRRLVEEIDPLYKTVHQAWRDQFGGDLVALHLLKQVLYAERERIGFRDVKP
ncbi:hypothetical protein [Pseudomonas chlororaphis]|uniref:hypothetical protein n=1 Tax=Pseudomonas chlororaphis TaxID=587753 RepID=UPI002D782E83|nr:hypothetical protein [Pseudomonas chlororaphis]